MKFKSLTKLIKKKRKDTNDIGKVKENITSEETKPEG